MASAKDSGAIRLQEVVQVLPEVVTFLFGAFAIVVIGIALAYIIGFAVSMMVAIFYVPIEAIAHADMHLPAVHMPHLHLPHHA